jgi:hypothetical protein
VTATNDGPITCAKASATLSATAKVPATFSWFDANNVLVGTGPSITVQTGLTP